MRKFLVICILVSILNTISLNTSAQNTNYEVYALRFTEVSQLFPISLLAMHAPDKDSGHLVFMIWLIKGNGKNILVDAGYLNGIEEAKGFPTKGYIRPDSTLYKLGLQPKDITDIIITHPHWDHIDGIDLFPNAHVWMQKDDFNYFVGAAWQKDGKNGGFNRGDVHKAIDMNMSGRLTLVDGDNKEIIPGITVYTGSRHTFNSQYVLVKSGADKIIIASDNAYTYYNIEHQVSAPPPNGTFDTTGYKNSIGRMKTLASNPKFIIPGHDGMVFSKFPVVAEGVVKIK